MVAAYKSVPVCAPVKSLNIVDERIPGLCVCSLSKSVSVLPLQTLLVRRRSVLFFSMTLGKVVVKTLAVFGLDGPMLNHFFIRKSRDCFANSESFRLMGFKVVEVFEQVVNPDFKDAFDSDEAVWVLLVLKELAAIRPLESDPIFRE